MKSIFYFIQEPEFIGKTAENIFLNLTQKSTARAVLQTADKGTDHEKRKI